MQTDPIFLEHDSSPWQTRADLIQRATRFVPTGDAIECQSCFDFVAALLGLLISHRSFNVHPAAGDGAATALARICLTNAEIDFQANHSITLAPPDLQQDARDERGWHERLPLDNWDEFWQAVLASRSRVGLYSSGTSGEPKLICHSIQSLARSVRCHPDRQADVWGLAFHPASFAGLQVLLQALANRNPIVWLLGSTPGQVHALIERTGLTHLSATPTLLRMLQVGQSIHPDVRRLNISGECADPDLIERLRRMFPHACVRNLYASTESGSLLSSDADVFTVPDEMAEKIRVDNGELRLHRSLLADQQALTDELGFFATGDRVEVIASNPLTFRFLTRDSRVINVGGRKVLPERVEAAVNEIAGVVDCVAWGQPNSVSGNLVCCNVVLADNATMDEAALKRELRERLAPHELPRLIRFVAKLDVTPTGKKRRNL